MEKQGINPKYQALAIIGVLDVTNLTLNGEVKNLQLGVNEIGKWKVVEYE